MKNNLEHFKTLSKEEILTNIKNDKNNAFISVYDNIENTNNKLIGIKDIHVYKGHKTTAGSKILSTYLGNYDSTVVSLLKENGFNIVGTLNMDEFAMGYNNATSYFGEVSSALDDNYYAGGSSGGSAYAVAKGLLPVATGTDTGGSIRQPAALNHIYGLKPTYGLISRYGTIAFASSFDTVGVLSNTIEDNALVLETLAKNDINDQTNYVPKDYEASSLINKEEKFKIGYVKEWMDQIKGSQIYDAINEKINILKDQGYEIEEVSIPTVKYSFDLYMIIAYSEASSNLSRYDGIRYGLKNETNNFSKHRRAFGQEVRKRLIIGGYMTSLSASEQYFSKAQKIRTKMINQVDELFKKYDLLIGPVTPDVGISKDKVLEEKQGHLYDFFLIPANLTGIPSMSVPIKKLTNNLGISLQVLANKYEEKKIYSFAKKIESMEN